ncbi:MAG: patatin-like phospholipase family protein [Candidatus Nanopelagicales bacterium]
MAQKKSPEPRSVAVVLTGAAARGAFQAGALATIVPELEARGLAPRIFLGASAGAINAALWGSFAHLGTDRAGRRLVDVWRSMGRKDILGHPAQSVLRDSWKLLPGSVAGRGPGLRALLDTEPLLRTSRTVFDGERLARNVTEDVISAVGVVATRMPGRNSAMGTARSVVFLDTRLPSDGVADPARAVDVAAGPLTGETVLASAAIPVAFPAVRLDQPATAAGWYVDGGVRMNAPLRPAVALGADTIVVVSADATDYAPAEPPAEPGEPWPDVADATALVLHTVLGDRMIEDLHNLRQRNDWIAQGLTPVSTSGRAYRPVSAITVAPRPGELGNLAEFVMTRKRLSRWRSWLRESDLFALERVLRGIGEGTGQRELLSYVLFDDEYFAAQIDIGANAARAAIADLDRRTGTPEAG